MPVRISRLAAVVAALAMLGLAGCEVVTPQPVATVSPATVAVTPYATTTTAPVVVQPPPPPVVVTTP